MLFIEIIDYFNKRKILEFFFSKFKNKELIIIDIGAHKGETIDLFMRKLNIQKILSIEPNIKLYENLLKNKKYIKKNIKFLNIGLGNKSELKKLNIFYDTSSSTFNSIDTKSNYFKRKNRILTFFGKSKNFFDENQTCKILKTSDFLKNEQLQHIDILKIDTEGFEFNILKGLEINDFSKIDYIYFEHHYDLMIKKNYKFFDVNKLLVSKNFKLKLKLKMKFRKTFEYIYERSKKTD